MRADVAIVGAGLFGSSLAVELARAGMRVELTTKSTPASGDTGRSFGMVRAHYSNEVTVRLAKRGIELLRRPAVGLRPHGLHAARRRA